MTEKDDSGTLRCLLFGHNYVVEKFDMETAYYRCQRCGRQTTDFNEVVP